MRGTTEQAEEALDWENRLQKRLAEIEAVTISTAA